MHNRSEFSLQVGRGTTKKIDETDPVLESP